MRWPKRPSATGEPPTPWIWAPEFADNWHHTELMQWWCELVTDPRSPLGRVLTDLPGTVVRTTAKGTVRKITTKIGTAEEMAAKLAAVYDAQRSQPPSRWPIKQHVLRKLTLDLVCASYPEGHPPPSAIVELLRRALDLPESHEVGTWPLIAGLRDDRGGTDHEMRAAAQLIDEEHLVEHDEYMPVYRLAQLVEGKLGRKPDRKSLRKWRDEPDYWPIWKRRPSGTDE